MLKFVNEFFFKLIPLRSLINKSFKLIIRVTAIYFQLIICLLPSRAQIFINNLLSHLAYLIEDQITYFVLFSDPSRMANRIVNWFQITDPTTVIRLSRKLYLQSSDASLRERLSNSVVSHLAAGFFSGKIKPHPRLLASLERWTLRAYQENKLCQLLTAFTTSELFNSLWEWFLIRHEFSTLSQATSFIRSTLFVAQHFTSHHSNLCISLQLILDRLNNNIQIIENQTETFLND